MSEERLQRYDLISPSEWECAGMGESDTGEWVGYEPWMDDADAEIARLRELVEAQHATIKTTAEALMTVGPGPDMEADIHNDSPEDAVAWDLGIIVQELRASIAVSEEAEHE